METHLDPMRKKLIKPIACVCTSDILLFFLASGTICQANVNNTPYIRNAPIVRSSVEASRHISDNKYVFESNKKTFIFDRLPAVNNKLLIKFNNFA